MSGEEAAPGPDLDDEALISLNDDQVQGWSDRLGVTVNALQVAVEKVGPKVADVRRFLRK